MGWGPGADGGGKRYCVKPTPTNIPELGKAGSLSFVRGREAALPLAGKKRGWVQALDNHHLGDTWHGGNVLPWREELKASCGFCLKPLVCWSALHCVPVLRIAQDSAWLAHVSW